MKKLTLQFILILVIALITIPAFAASLQTANSAFTVGNKSARTMDIQFRLPDFEVSKEVVDGTVYHKIKVKDAGYFMETGAPELPYLTTMVAIPNHGKASIEVINSHEKVLKEYNPYPAQSDAYTSTGRGFQENQAIYASGQQFPREALLYSDPQIMRDFRIVTIQIQPFIWDSATNQLIVRDQVDIRLNFNDEPGINELNSSRSISPSFDKIYQSMILNYNDFRTDTTQIAQTPDRIVVISGAYDNTTYQNMLKSFILWKKQKGAEVSLLSTTATGSTNTEIKAYLQRLYNDLSTRPDYIILVGDVTGSFPVPTWNIGGAGDYPYQMLAGSDQLGDCFIGRISAEDTSQLSIIMNKIYSFEKNINMATADYLNRMLLVGDSSHSGISVIYLQRYIQELSLEYNPDYTFTMLCNSAPSVAEMNTAISNGVGIFDYRGYINMSGWAPSSSLTNTNKLCHAVIITCSTGNFDGATQATTEDFIRLGTALAPTGAVTAIGMYQSGTHTMPNNVLTGAIFDGIFARGMRTMGEALLNGKLYMNAIYGISQPTMATTFTQWCNLMGDPSLEIFIRIPHTFTTNMPDTLDMGTTTLGINVLDENATAVANACVTISQGSAIRARAYTNSSGFAYLTVTSPLTSGTATITISKHDFKPTQTTLPISGGGIVFQSSVIDDDALGFSNGNANGIVNAAETIEYKASIKNSTSAAISAVTGTMTINDPYVQVFTSTMNFGTIAANATALNSSATRFYIRPNCPDHHQFNLVISGTSSTGPWTFTVQLEVRAANLEYQNYSIVGVTNAVINPGSVESFMTTVKNEGSESVSNVRAILRSLNSSITVLDSTAYMGTISSGSTYTNSSDVFRIYTLATCRPGMVIPMSLYLYNDNGFQETDAFSITIGSATITDPLGQDAYGYFIYDDGDVNYPERPTYQWVEIAPEAGGSGTALPISDAASSTEGDAVTAVSLATVNLPFTFRFYGINYTQMTVCSNGFIAMGVTQDASFRNYRLPGAMGPAPMIAPFWDDLATTSTSGIYVWSDTANHRYIVEWYQMVNGYSTSQQETFQVILYDPIYYPTSTMDGPIKIQYQTFNNVDSGTGNQEHGVYSSIGIQDHYHQSGLEYSFNNTYPTAAKPLTNNSALYITTKVSNQNTPSLTVGQTNIEDSNGNGYIEPGEEVNFGIRLSNSSSTSLTNVSAEVSLSDPYVTITHPTSPYGTIAGLGSALNTQFFTFTVAANCPTNHTINLQMVITATGGYSWTKTISLQVHKPSLSLQAWTIDDVAGNHNGVFDIGETSWLVMNIRNETNVDAQNIQLNIASNNANVTLGTPQITVSSINGLSTYQAVSQVVVGNSVTNGTSVTFTLNGTSSNAAPISSSMSATIGVLNFAYDFETTNGAFVATNSLTPGWDWGVASAAGSHSGSKVWGCVLSGTYGNNAQYELVSQSYRVGTGASLTFWHRYFFEHNYYDGGRVLISTDDGATWTVVTPDGGYPATTISALGGPGYGHPYGNTAMTAWALATFNLTDYAGRSIKVKWQMKSDNSVVNSGWFIDDVTLTNPNGIGTIGIIQGTVALNPADPEIVYTSVSAGTVFTNPAEDGSYKLRLTPGAYTVTGSLPGYTTATASATVVLNSTVSNIALALNYMHQPIEMTWMIQNNQLSLRWVNDGRPAFLHYNIYRKGIADTWVQIAETNTPLYTVPISQNSVYDYMITAQFDTGESVPSNVVQIVYPNSDAMAAPAIPQNIVAQKTGNQVILNWDPVIYDINDNVIIPWGYRIYASDTPDFVPSVSNYLATSTTTSWTYVPESNVSKRFFKVKAILGYVD